MRVNYELVDKAINDYNKYRSPEAIAYLIDINGRYLTIKFEGSICFTCGFYDYFEDLIYILINYGVLCKIVEVLAEGEEITVKYEVVGLNLELTA